MTPPEALALFLLGLAIWNTYKNWIEDYREIEKARGPQQREETAEDPGRKEGGES